MATEPGRMVIHLDGPIKIHDPLITWSCKIIISPQFEKFVYLFSQNLQIRIFGEILVFCAVLKKYCLGKEVFTNDGNTVGNFVNGNYNEFFM